jgi:hypothetical protein
MRTSTFRGLVGTLPTLPPDIEQFAPSVVIQQLDKQLTDLNKRKNKLIKSGADFNLSRKISVRDVRFTKSGRANNRSRAGKTYNEEEGTGKSFEREINGIDENIRKILSDNENQINLRVLEWRPLWRTFGSLQGLREG